MTEPNPRWKQRPPGSNWGDFGPDDQRGRMNLLTREKVLQGIAEVKTGETFCLSLPLDYPGKSLLNPARHPPVLRPTLRQNAAVNFNFPLGRIRPGATDVVCDDLAILHLQYSTQWDSFAHVGSHFDADGDGVAEAVFYNGFRAGIHVVGPDDPADAGAVSVRPIATASTSSARALGIENLARGCVQGRAVMIDLRQHYGDARTLIGYDKLMRAMEADQVIVERGDMVCLHTGFADKLLEWGREPTVEQLENTAAQLDGRDERLLQWITDSNLVALIADNYAVEAIPARDGGACCAGLPLHEHCLFKLGVHLGEIWHLGPLAKRLRELGRTRFLLTAPPLYLPGAVGSPATPVATI